MSAVNRFIAKAHFGNFSQWAAGLLHHHIRARHQIRIDVRRLFQHGLPIVAFAVEAARGAGLAADADDGHGDARVVAGEVGPFEAGVGKADVLAAGKEQRPQDGHLLPLADGVGGYKGGGAGGGAVLGVVGGFDEPASHVVEAFPAFAAVVKNGLQVGFLFGALPCAAQVRRVAADVGFAAFVGKVDFGLVERRWKQVVAGKFDACACGRADAEPVQPQGVARHDPVLVAEG